MQKFLSFLIIISILVISNVSLCSIHIIVDTRNREVPNYEESLKDLVDEFEERLQLKKSRNDTVKVVLTYSREEFNQVVGNGIPDWGAGVANPVNNTVYLLLTESTRSVATLELTIHEIAHIMLHKALGDIHIPRWFDEGYAQWASGESFFEKSHDLALANLLGNNVPLRDLEPVNSFDKYRANLAYAESRAAFEYLIERIDSKDVSILINQIAKAKSFEQGFYNTFGMTLDEFYSVWSEERVSRYNWYILFADWRIWFIFIAVFFIIVGTIKIIKHRKKKSQEDIVEEV